MASSWSDWPEGGGMELALGAKPTKEHYAFEIRAVAKIEEGK